MRVFAVACLAISVVATTAAAEQKKPKASPRAPKKPPKPPPEPPKTPEKIRADGLFEDGRKYLVAKEYALACTAFEQSQEADPAIGTQLNIALCYEEWGKVAAAYRAYLEAERLAKAKSDDREKGAHLKVDALAPQVPHLQVEIPADADVATVFLLDGKEIDRAKLADDQLVEPGPHILEARVPSRPPKETKIDLKPGERRKVTIAVPRPEVKTLVTTTPRKKGRLYGGIGLVTGGAVAVGVSSFVALVARQDYADAIKDCPDKVCESRASFDATQSARKRATIMTFVGAGGVVLAGVGVYMIMTSRGKRVVEERRVGVAPLLAPDAVGLAIGGRL